MLERLAYTSKNEIKTKKEMDIFGFNKREIMSCIFKIQGSRLQRSEILKLEATDYVGLTNQLSAAGAKDATNI